MKTVQRVVFLMAGLCCLSPAHANNAKVDSLKRLLQSHTMTDKAEVLWNIAYELFDVDNPQAVFYAERAYHDVWVRGDSLQIVKVGTTYGQLLRRVGKLDQSIEVSSCLLPVARRNDLKKYIKMLLNSMAMAFTYREMYDKALEYYYESLNMRKMDGDTTEILVALQNLGFIFYKLEDFSEANALSESVIKMAKYPRHDEQIAVAYLTIGSSFFDRRKYHEAAFNLRKAIKIDSERSLMNIRAQLFQVYSHTLFNLGKPDSSRLYATEAIRIARERMDPWQLTMSHFMLAKVEMKARNFVESNRTVQSIDSILRDFPAPMLHANLLKLRISLLLEMKEPNFATLFEGYLHFLDSVHQSHTNARIRQLHISYSQRENLAKIENQAGILNLQEVALKRNRQGILLISSLLMIVLVLIVMLYKAYIRKKKINRMLDQRVVERTKELLMQRDSLQHYMDEERVKKAKISSELMSRLNTLSGLLKLVILDSQNSVSLALKADELAEELKAMSKGIKLK